MNGLDSARLSFHGLLSPWVAAILLAAASIAIFVLYFSERGKFGASRRVLMALFRVAVVGTALFLLTRPVLIAETKGERARGIVLLIDNSLSMTQRDQRLSTGDRLRVALAENLLPPESTISDATAGNEVPAGTSEDPSRAALVRSVLANPRLKLLDGMAKAGPLRVSFFGQRVRGLPEESKDPKSPPSPLVDRISREMKNEETLTNLADAILDRLTKNETDLPSAIVVVTDGQDNASRETLDEAARQCSRLGVPLHIYGVGSSEIGNLELKDVVVPETIFFDDTVAVPVRWRCRGFKQGSAEIILTLGGQVVARKDVSLKEGEDFRDELTFTPRKAAGGDQKTELKASLRYKGNEAFSQDNELQRPVTVVDRKVKILYIEGSPRWEYKFLQTALLRDRRVEAKFLVANADRRALASGGPYLAAFPAARQELFAFDVLILGDVALEFVGAERVNWLRDFVREGGSLIFIAGRQHAPSEYVATPLAEVLPVEFASMRFASAALERPQAFVPQLTRTGTRSEMLALADTPEESQRTWQMLPGFYWFFPVTKLRAGAAALLVHPRQKAGEQSVPVVATHYYGKGQVLYMGTDETWRWRANGGEKIFGRFWGQVIYQMGLPHLIGTPKRVQLALEKPENVLGKPSSIYARVFDAEFRPFAGPKVNGRLERMDARPGEERSRAIVLDPVPGLPGEYRALLAHDTVGKFLLKVDEPASASLEYRVSLPPQHELQVGAMDEEALRQAALAAGGKFYREEDLHTLAANLKPAKTAFLTRHETLLWNSPMLILFVGLIATEWILRKFSNLS